MSFSEQVSQVGAQAGTTLIYTMTINVTGSTAFSVQVTDVLSNSVSFISFGSVPPGGVSSWNPGTQTLGWSGASLAPGTYTISYLVIVNNSAACGSNISDTPQLTYQGGGSTLTANTSVTVQCGTATFTPTNTLTPGTLPVSTPIVYPNPCDGTVPAQMQVNLGTSAPNVKIQVFTTAFRKVKDSELTNVPAGVLQVSIDMKDNWGAPLASGLYYVVVTNGSNRAVGKILVIR